MDIVGDAAKKLAQDPCYTKLCVLNPLFLVCMLMQPVFVQDSQATVHWQCLRMMSKVESGTFARART